MGIKNLHKFLTKHCPNIYVRKHLSSFGTKTVAIDTSLYMYRIKYSNNNNFIDGFIKQIMRLLRNRITPVYIFYMKVCSHSSSNSFWVIDFYTIISDHNIITSIIRTRFY